MKHLRWLCVWLVWVLAATACSAQTLKLSDPAAAGFDAEKLQAITAAMQRHIERGELVGGLGVVARGDKVVYAEAWGQRIVPHCAGVRS